MNSLQRLALGVSLAGLLLPATVVFSEDSVELSKSAKEKIALESISNLKVGSYNVRNLFEENGKLHDRTDRLFQVLPLSSGPMDEPLKALNELKAQAKAILDNDFDVLAIEEVENIKALSALNEEFLDGIYDSYLIEGNDPRGIDVGFFVKNTLPFKVEQRTHKEETWSDPTAGGKKTRVFSRDLPSLIFRTEKNSAPFMIYFGTHFKSKRDRPHDPESRILRKAQAERASEIVRNYEKEFGAQTPIFLAGDFNGEIHREKEFASLGSVASLEDSFNVISPPLSDEERITHSFFPKDGQAKWAQLDAVMANNAAEKLILEAKVYRYKDAKGLELPIPKNFKDVKNNPSDHFPVQVDLDFKKLVQTN